MLNLVYTLESSGEVFNFKISQCLGHTADQLHQNVCGWDPRIRGFKALRCFNEQLRLRTTAIEGSCETQTKEPLQSGEHLINSSVLFPSYSFWGTRGFFPCGPLENGLDAVLQSILHQSEFMRNVSLLFFSQTVKMARHFINWLIQFKDQFIPKDTVKSHVWYNVNKNKCL